MSIDPPRQSAFRLATDKEIEIALDNIRKEKCCIIDDLFRVKRMSACINPRHLTDVTEDWWETFIEYYELPINALELKLATLSARLSRYMRQQTLNSNI